MKYIAPPKLNRKFVVYGFTVFEAFAILGFILLGLVTHKTFLIPPAALIAALCFRPPGSDRNAMGRVRILFNYFKKYQAYCLRECDKK